MHTFEQGYFQAFKLDVLIPAAGTVRIYMKIGVAINIFPSYLIHNVVPLIYYYYLPDCRIIQLAYYSIQMLLNTLFCVFYSLFILYM